MRTAHGWVPWAMPDEAIRAGAEALPYGKLGETPGDDLARAVLEAALPFLKFSPSGDNHHNAAACPYCTPRERGA